MISAALRRAVARAGAPGGILFTERQLYFELCRTLQPLCHAPRRLRFTVPAPIGYGRFQRTLSRWPGEVPGLLTAPRRPAPAPPPEVFEYGLPRVLVCQDRGIADMLLANGLHMESVCPVFAADDLPLDHRLRAALEAGTGRVYVLHDTGDTGAATIDAVTGWAEETPVVPLGLRPVHAAALHLPRAGRVAEVAAVNPARLLRTVHRLVREQYRARRSLPRLRRLAATGYLSWPAPESPHSATNQLLNSTGAS
ncbi:hypothetical protein [Virgisporangium aurantiacum]|uniref:Uncharacterized protein n=1 Tax=Virgisporangium aurantiacum TaxID=175570 RepID=A0A8J4E2L7_9ACTN|nr:hypothetical protein [Virgisporangium aurantiacum]GIJ59995.1 hypothetical protein Vau01_075110 [Virgisporangium aurantiacum]